MISTHTCTGNPPMDRVSLSTRFIASLPRSLPVHARQTHYGGNPVWPKPTRQRAALTWTVLCREVGGSCRPKVRRVGRIDHDQLHTDPISNRSTWSSLRGIKAGGAASTSRLIWVSSRHCTLRPSILCLRWITPKSTCTMPTARTKRHCRAT